MNNHHANAQQAFTQNVNQLVQMGFNQQQAMQALQRCNGNLQYALEVLTTGVQPQQPQPQQQNHGNMGRNMNQGGAVNMQGNGGAMAGDDELQRALAASMQTSTQEN